MRWTLPLAGLPRVLVILALLALPCLLFTDAALAQTDGSGEAIAEGAEALEQAAEALGDQASDGGGAAAGVDSEVSFILNTFLFLVSGFLVFFMAAGFAMLETGLVRKRSVATQCLKNIGLFSIACMMYYTVGYNLMYTDVDLYFGSFTAFYEPSPDEASAAFDAGGYAVMSDWFFQVMFVATAASIVSGTLAERIKLVPFFLFIAILTGFIYPITASWEWGGGWLDQQGFSDFAGSTLVHSVGGWAALAGAIVLGARRGKFGPGGQINVMPGSNLPLATLGTFILWLGWFGFNGGSQLAMGTGADVIAVANIFANTNLAACGGAVTALILTQFFYKKADLTMVLNGAIAGLVAITAEPLAPSAGWSIIIGAIGGLIVVFTVPMLEKMRIDDVVGAIPVHLFAGIWGTMIVPFSNSDADYYTQFIGVLAYGVAAFLVSLIIFGLFRLTIGLRPDPEEEDLGIDVAETGLEAYPEFGPAR